MRPSRTLPRFRRLAPRLAALLVTGSLCACAGGTPNPSATRPRMEPAVQPATPSDLQRYDYPETRELVALVSDAAALVESEGERAFGALAEPGSRWRREESYVFVLDLDGTMLVHPDPALAGKRQLALTDVDGRPLVRGLIAAATEAPARPEGWYHYEWPVPGGLLPRWKSSYVQLVAAPSGRRYVVGSGVYNDRMERAFVVDMVERAVALIEARGAGAFPLFHDRTGPFIAKDAYVFIIEPGGVEVVNPAHPNLEGRNVLDVRDTQGKPFVREFFDLVRTRGAGWVDYMWPKPGESISTQKSTYVSRARVGDSWLLVGAGVYLADAPAAAARAGALAAPDLVALVRDGAALLERRGEAAYPELRARGSRWFTDETYFFVWALDGTRVFHAADPGIEGQDASGERDVVGRPYGRMFLEAARGPSGEGWVHYMYPEPGGLFPRWKSAYVKRVTFPSGRQYLVGAGVYEMQLDRTLVRDVVDRAAALVAERGPAAFDVLRDRTGAFVFMDSYVFVETTEGLAVCEPGQPSLEGTNLMDVRDVKGKTLVRDYIAAAERDGSAWVEYYWYRPGDNTPRRKEAYVRLVRSGGIAYVVGSGLYVDE